MTSTLAYASGPAWGNPPPSLARVMTFVQVTGLLPGDLRAGGRASECLQIRLDPATALGMTIELTGTVVSPATPGAATPHEPRTGCAPPRHRTSGSRSRRTSSADTWAPARRPPRRSPSPGGRRVRAGGGHGSKTLRTRSAGAGSACRPASGPISASHPNAPHDWCGSTTPHAFSRRVPPSRASPPRAATPTSPTCTARSGSCSMRAEDSLGRPLTAPSERPTAAPSSNSSSSILPLRPGCTSLSPTRPTASVPGRLGARAGSGRGVGRPVGRRARPRTQEDRTGGTGPSESLICGNDPRTGTRKPGLRRVGRSFQGTMREKETSPNPTLSRPRAQTHSCG